MPDTSFEVDRLLQLVAVSKTLEPVSKKVKSDSIQKNVWRFLEVMTYYHKFFTFLFEMQYKFILMLIIQAI